MKEQIQKLVNAQPFRAFVVDLGHDHISIPTPDHVFPLLKTLVIEDDQGNLDLIPYQHILRIRQKVST